MAHQRASRAAVDGKRRGSKFRVTTNLLVRRRLLLAAAVLFGACLFGDSGVVAPARAQSGVFAGMAGRWAGGGTVTLEDGATERIRCRATYAVGGPEMSLTLLCASDSYRFDLNGRVVAQSGGVITGNWSESSRGVNGSLEGRGGGGSFRLVASAPGFNANISLVTHGNRQSVVIRGESQFREASITLSR